VVQGVYFRKFTLEKAIELRLTGFVENKDDGSVYCEVEGDDARVQLFMDWCSIGSPMSQVTSVEVKRMPAIIFQNFEIRD